MRNLMRGAFVGAAVALSATAAEAQGCPERAPLEIIRTLGPEIARLSDSETVYRPPGLRLLGQPVPYVVVERYGALGGALGPIEHLSFRLGSQRRASGEGYSTALITAFNRAHPDDYPCEVDSLSCDVRSEDSAAFELLMAKLGEADIYISDEARGPGLAAVRADDDMDMASPAYLVCEYEEGDWRSR